jgi:tartrate-resistant acid phosphatase type 5
MVLKFIALGDMGSGTKDQKKVAKGMETVIEELREKHLKNISFIVGLGDNIYECGVKSADDPQFHTKFEKPYKKIDKEFYMCLGNHDYYQEECCGSEFKDSPEHEIAYSAISKKWVMPYKHYYYTYDIDKKTHVDFFVMDTNIDRMPEEEKVNQLDFLIEGINKSTAKWKILYGHHPWRSLGDHGHAEPELEEYFRMLVNKTRGKGLNTIDLYMCGHDHTKQYLEIFITKNLKIPLVVCGTGGKLDDTPIPDLTNSKDNDYNIHFISNTLGFMCVKIFNEALELFFFDHTGKKVEFRYTIEK